MLQENKKKKHETPLAQREHWSQVRPSRHNLSPQCLAVSVCELCNVDRGGSAPAHPSQHPMVCFSASDILTFDLMRPKPRVPSFSPHTHQVDEALCVRVIFKCMTLCFFFFYFLWPVGRCCVLYRRQVEWEAASSLIEGICLTLQRQPIISFLPHLRSLINVCVNLVRKKHIQIRKLQ